MLCFTWNLHRTEAAFRAAISYLADLSGDFVATLQELPAVAKSTPDATKQVALLTKGKRPIRCHGVIGSSRASGRVGLFTSDNISITASIIRDSRDRMLMATLANKSWGKALQVVGLHAVDRINTHLPYERGRHAEALRMHIEGFRFPKVPLIVMGDFNAEPYHEELCTHGGFLALRDRKEVLRDWRDPTNSRPIQPLYNPMWCLLPEQLKHPSGTLKLSTHAQGVRWRHCDQILVSRELVDMIDGKPQIPSRLGGVMLTNRRGNPDEAISDHLPVRLRVKMS